MSRLLVNVAIALGTLTALGVLLAHGRPILGTIVTCVGLATIVLRPPAPPAPPTPPAAPPG